jgi:hypothetical protein
MNSGEKCFFAVAETPRSLALPEMTMRAREPCDTIWNLSRSRFDKVRDTSVNEVYLLENFAGDNFLA